MKRAQIFVIDTPKGRYFFYHVISFIRDKLPHLEIRLIPADELQLNSDAIVFADRSFRGADRKSIFAIEDFVDEDKVYSFSKEHVNSLVEVLGKCDTK